MIDTQNLEIGKAGKFTGTVSVPGDHLLTCHGIFLGILSGGTTTLENTPRSEWLLRLIQTLGNLGYPIEQKDTLIKIENGGHEPNILEGPTVPGHEIILMALGGIFAGYRSDNSIRVEFDQISRKSLEVFKKVFDCETLSEPDDKSYLELIRVKGINPVILENFPGEEYLAKTGILYYHLAAKTRTELNCFNTGPNHLENLLPFFCNEVEIITSGMQEMSEFEKRMARKLKSYQKPETKIILPDLAKLQGSHINVPGDTSLSSVYILAATLIPGSELELDNVLLNPSRSKFITALRRMDASIEVLRKKEDKGESHGDIKVNFSPLKGRKFDFESLTGMKDEIPLLIIAAAFAEGKSVIRDVTHLRTFEQDLLKQIITTLKNIQVEIGELEDGLVIQGDVEYDGHTYNTYNNAMLGFACMILGLKSHGTTVIENPECMEQLFPGAIENIRNLAAG